MTISIMGRPDSVWRLTSYLWNLRARYPLSFPKTDLVRRLSVIVRRFIVTQNRKQRLAIKKAPMSNMAAVKEARLQLAQAHKLDNTIQTNSLSKGVAAGSIPARLSFFYIRK